MYIELPIQTHKDILLALSPIKFSFDSLKYDSILTVERSTLVDLFYESLFCVLLYLQARVPDNVDCACPTSTHTTLRYELTSSSSFSFPSLPCLPTHSHSLSVYHTTSYHITAHHATSRSIMSVSSAMNRCSLYQTTSHYPLLPLLPYLSLSYLSSPV